MNEVKAKNLSKQSYFLSYSNLILQETINSRSIYMSIERLTKI